MQSPKEEAHLKGSRKRKKTRVAGVKWMREWGVK